MSIVPNQVSLCVSPTAELPGASASVSMREAYERVAAELAAIPDQALMRVNVDTPVAVAAVLDKLPALRSLRAAWLATVPSIDVANLDRLEDLALALAHTQTLLPVVAEASSELPEAYEGALAQRDSLLATAKALAAYGLLDPSRFGRVGLDRGYRNVAYDLAALAGLFRVEWSRIGDRCPFDVAEVERAESRANALLRGSVERARTPGPTASSLKDRQRAFTALSRAYDEVRRAVAFLRWHQGDASSFAPGLVPGGRGVSRRQAGRDEERVEASSAAPSVPTHADDLGEVDDAAFESRGKDSLFAPPDGR